jgi:GMP synthase-like glutamine amidotransferase
MRPILVIEQEWRLAGLGLLGQRFEALGLPVRRVQAWRHDIADVRLEDYSAVVPLGGNAHAWAEDEYPYVRAERELLEQAVEGELPVLGICLGAQVLARTLGASVEPGDELEYGWRRIELVPAAADDRLLGGLDGQTAAFQWHTDSFTLPAGAVHLASSEMFPNQAFRYGAAWGVQFHPEVDYATFRFWIGNHPDACEELGIDEEALHREVAEGDERDRAWRAALFDAFGRLVAQSEQAPGSG